jgi:hypothetical protein
LPHLPLYWQLLSPFPVLSRLPGALVSTISSCQFAPLIYIAHPADLTDLARFFIGRIPSLLVMLPKVEGRGASKGASVASAADPRRLETSDAAPSAATRRDAPAKTGAGIKAMPPRAAAKAAAAAIAATSMDVDGGSHDADDRGSSDFEEVAVVSEKRAAAAPASAPKQPRGAGGKKGAAQQQRQQQQRQQQEGGPPPVFTQQEVDEVGG